MDQNKVKGFSGVLNLQPHALEPGLLITRPLRIPQHMVQPWISSLGQPRIVATIGTVRGSGDMEDEANNPIQVHVDTSVIGIKIGQS